MAKRSCRRTTDENLIHKKAVEMRKKTDEQLVHYVEDRVAFRETAVRFYMDATYAVFGEFSEDLHMYGKDGEVFPADDGYIRAYQHLATDEELIDSLVTYLDRTNQYLEKQGIPFVFLAGLGILKV